MASHSTGDPTLSSVLGFPSQLGFDLGAVGVGVGLLRIELQRALQVARGVLGRAAPPLEQRQRGLNALISCMPDLAGLPVQRVRWWVLSLLAG